MDILEQRLQVLECRFQRSRRANRILILAVVIIGCLTGAQGVSPQAPKPTTPRKVPSKDDRRPDERALLGRDRLRTVEADQLVLLDRLGRSRLRMAVSDGGPTMSMFDENGRTRLELGLSGASSGLRLLDANESPIVSLQLPQDVGSARLEIRSPQGSTVTKADGLSVRDAADQGRLLLALINGNFPMLGLSQSGQSGPPSIELTAPDGSRSFKIHDHQGRPLFWVFAAGNGKTSVSMRHPDHERSLQISTGPKDVDGPTIAFFAPAKADGAGGQLPLLRLGLHKDRQPYVRIVGADGRTRFAAPSE